MYSTTPTVVDGSIWNFDGVFVIVWKYAYAFGIFLIFFLSLFSGFGT